MDTQQIISDLELVRDILNIRSADASPARRAAAAVLLRAAADAIEAQSESRLRPLENGEEIKAGDVCKLPSGETIPADTPGQKYSPKIYHPHFRPVNG